MVLLSPSTLRGRPGAAPLLLALGGFAVAACGSEDAPQVSAPSAASAQEIPQAEARVISGRYEVSGVTRAVGGNEERDVEGTIILSQDGSRYTSTFDLTTTFPGRDAELEADVIGHGDGVIDGDRLVGTAKTQLVVSTVPGVDAGFAFAPRMVGARIISKSVAEFQSDGSIVIEIENEPAEGDSYLPTRTRMTGVRVEIPGRSP